MGPINSFYRSQFFVDFPSQYPNFQRHMSCFYVQWVGVRCGCSFCWYCWNYWASLFKISFHKFQEILILNVSFTVTGQEKHLLSLSHLVLWICNKAFVDGLGLPCKQHYLMQQCIGDWFATSRCFLGYPSFPHQRNWSPRCKWKILENGGVKDT